MSWKDLRLVIQLGSTLKMGWGGWPFWGSILMSNASPVMDMTFSLMISLVSWWGLMNWVHPMGGFIGWS